MKSHSVSRVGPAAWAGIALAVATMAPSLTATPVINEIHFHPLEIDHVEPVAEEFIELYNPTGSAIDLAGYRFSRGISYTFPEQAEIGADGYVIIAADPAVFLDKHENVDASYVYGPWEGKLSNSGERIRLDDSAGEAVDTVHYYDQGDWADRREFVDENVAGWEWQSRADGGGRSLELLAPHMPNDTGQNWRSSRSTGVTPGARNGWYTDNAAPLIHDVAHEPAVPGANDSVNVRASVLNETLDEVDVSLHWRVADATPEDFEVMVMAPSSNDPSSFHAVIPPQPERTVIEFYVRAEEANRKSTWPAPTTVASAFATGKQEANALYQVDEERLSNELPVYRLIMTELDRRRFDSINRQSNAQMNATLIISNGGEHEVRHQCGVRVRGNSSRFRTPPPKKITLPRDKPWNGQTAFNLNSVSPESQFVGNLLFTAAGLTAPEVRLVQVRDNGGNIRPHIHVEAYGSEFVSNHFPEDRDGNLYRKRSANTSRDFKRWGVHFERTAAYERERWFEDDEWDKASNASEDDWSDLQAFVETMHQAEGDTYLDQVGQVIHLDQWLRWFAVMTLLNNTETNLGNGIDDDYAMFAGRTDRRFLLLPHDLDSIFNGGVDASLFPMIDTSFGNGVSEIPQLKPFFAEPSIVRRYYQHMAQLLETTFSKERFDALIDGSLAGTPFENRANRMKTFMDGRRDFVSQTIQVNFAFSSSDLREVVEQDSVTLTGRFNPLKTVSIEINGQPAEVDVPLGRWRATVPLLPGFNVLTMNSVGEDGEEVERETREIRYRHETNTDIAPIVGDVVWTAEEGPYLVSENVIIPRNASLTIEPGTNVYFEAGAKLTVVGILRAVGTADRRIRFTADPNGPLVPDIREGLPNALARWGGIQFQGTMSEENVIAYADIRHAQSNAGSVGVVDSQVTLNHVTFGDTRLRMVYAERGSILVDHCFFADMFEADENPAELGFDNVSEHIKGLGGIAEGGRFIVRNSHFGANRGHNDVIDVDSGRLPGHIVEIRDNVFTSTGCEFLDLGGDVYVTGNHFQNVAKDAFTSDRGYASAISAGDTLRDATIFVSRNVFWDIDHAVNAKNNATVIFEQNTVVKVHPDFTDQFGRLNVASVINFFVDEPGGTPAKGAYVANNLIWDTPRVFGNENLPAGRNTLIQFDHNFAAQNPFELARLEQWGEGNVSGENPFVDVEHGDFRLTPDAAARAVGNLGQDLGASIEEGLVIRSNRPAITPETSVMFEIGAAGLTAYRWRLDEGPWSETIAIGEGFDLETDLERTGILEFSNLEPGEHQLVCQGQDVSGHWVEALTEVQWTVDPQALGLRFSELLVRNQTVFPVGEDYPDVVELENVFPHEIDLTGLQIADDEEGLEAFVFPAGTRLPAGERLLLFGGDSAPVDSHALGFGLEGDGEELFLRHSDGNVIDHVVWGRQLPDQSLSRKASGEWALTPPTLGEPNAESVVLGNATALRLNEWLSDPSVTLEEDFVEIFNPLDRPVNLAGMILTDQVNLADAFKFPDHSYVAANGYAVFTGGSLPFNLASAYDWLTLADPEGHVIDQFLVQSRGADATIGRYPDGTNTIVTFELPTPGQPNYQRPPDGPAQSINPVNFSTTWRYATERPEDDWILADFDDSAWQSGSGVFGNTDLFGGGQVTTVPFNPPVTHYFRTSFVLPPNTSLTQLNTWIIADAGAVIYVNGQEAARVRLPLGALTPDTLATSTQSPPGFEQIELDLTLLQSGTNIIAVETHQEDETNQEMAFSLFLEGMLAPEVTDSALQENLTDLLNQLRITEVMYAPSRDRDAEFLELMNIGDTPLDLTGVRFHRGIRFTFPEMTLGPREFVLLVKDQNVFESVYGTDHPIAGEYGGRLDNSGETIALALPDPYLGDIARFRYETDWAPETDGGGHALQVLDVSAERAAWQDGRGWRSSIDPGGSPGDNGPPILVGPLRASGIQADPFTYQIQANNFATSYGAAGLPEGLEFNAETGLISGRALVFGVFDITLQATNAAGSDTATLELALEEKQPPVITSGESIEVMAFQEVNYQIEGTNIPETFTAEPLPEGLILSDFGFISGYPETVGVHEVLLGVTNFAGNDQATLTITVTENPVPAAIGAPQRPFRLGDRTWRDFVREENPPEDPLMAVRNNNLPSGEDAWLETTVQGPDTVSFSWEFETRGGSGYIYFQTSFGEFEQHNESFDWIQKIVEVPDGEHTIRWQVQNFDTPSVRLSLAEFESAADSPTPVITSPNILTGVAGDPIEIQIAASANPNAFALLDAPDWLSIDPESGLITGNTLRVGLTTFTVVATNDLGSGSAIVQLEIFPRLNADAGVTTPGLPWITGGDAPWRGELFVNHDGSGSLRSGPIGDNEESWIETTVTGPGTLSFWWEVESEECCDHLRLRVDGNQTHSIAGSRDWEYVETMIPAGRHTLRWVYTKDGSVSDGADLGRVDEITWIPQSQPGDDFDDLLEMVQLEVTNAGVIVTVAPLAVSRDVRYQLETSANLEQGSWNAFGAPQSFPIDSTTMRETRWTELPAEARYVRVRIE